MQNHQVQLSDVIYNAAEQSFEALVTVHDANRSRKYACSINAPISISYADAAKGLARQALRRHQKRGGIYSEMRRASAPLRAGRPSFDPRRWLQSLTSRSGHSAA